MEIGVGAFREESNYEETGILPGVVSYLARQREG
jgi:hypothetical protein